MRDEAAPIARLKELAERISVALVNEARTDENDLHAYFKFQERLGAARASRPLVEPAVPYPTELLNSARSLRRTDPATQATLRRSVSTAYYALFHFLVEEACANWTRPEQRHALARAFIHKHMFEVSNSRIRQYKNSARGSAEFQLYSVAKAFYRLQQERHKADYDMSNTLSAADVELAINLDADAFESWNNIRNEQIAPDYLFSMLFKERA